MNAQRRKALGKLVASLQEIRDEIETLQSEEREAFDNLPEGLQNAEKGQAMESAADTLQQAYDDLDNVISELEGLEG